MYKVTGNIPPSYFFVPIFCEAPILQSASSSCSVENFKLLRLGLYHTHLPFFHLLLSNLLSKEGAKNMAECKFSMKVFGRKRFIKTWKQQTFFSFPTSNVVNKFYLVLLLFQVESTFFLLAQTRTTAVCENVTKILTRKSKHANRSTHTKLNLIYFLYKHSNND